MLSLRHHLFVTDTESGSQQTSLRQRLKRELPRWTVVVAWLDGLPRRGASTTKIITAAMATFDAFARWAAVAREGVPWSI